jgi:hypothetical protein
MVERRDEDEPVRLGEEQKEQHRIAPAIVAPGRGLGGTEAVGRIGAAAQAFRRDRRQHLGQRGELQPEIDRLNGAAVIRARAVDRIAQREHHVLGKVHALAGGMNQHQAGAFEVVIVDGLVRFNA